MAQQIPNDGLIYFQGFWNRDHVLLTTAEGLAEVLVHRYSEFTKAPAARQLLQRLLGNALLISEGEDHKRMRKDATPAFGFRSVQDLVPMFWSKAADMSNLLEDSSVADLWTMGSKATLDTIGLAAVGTDFNTMRQPHELVHLYDTLFNPNLQMSLFYAANASLPRWAVNLLFSGFEKRVVHDRARLDDICRSFVEAMPKAHQRLGAAPQNSILDRLAARGTTKEELVTHLLMIIGAGFEPTAGAFCWVLWFLASHPDWQTRLRDELRTHLPYRLFTQDADHFDDNAALSDLAVLSAVCNETLRFLPTSPITTRVPPRDTTVLGHRVKAGTRVFVVPGAINRMEAFFGPTADEWDPSRWIDHDTGKAQKHGGATTNYAFSTFLHGPRRCIGQAYATAAVSTFVAVFVGRYEFEMADKNEVPVPTGVTTVRPRDGLKLSLRSVPAW